MGDYLPILIISALVGLVAQYLIIREAVASALQEHRRQLPEPKDDGTDNLLIALGFNPNDFAQIDREAEQVIEAEMKEFKKTKTYKSGVTLDIKAKQAEIIAKAKEQANIRKMELAQKKST